MSHDHDRRGYGSLRHALGRHAWIGADTGTGTGTGFNLIGTR